MSLYFIACDIDWDPVAQRSKVKSQMTNYLNFVLTGMVRLAIETNVLTGTCLSGYSSSHASDPLVATMAIITLMLFVAFPVSRLRDWHAVFQLPTWSPHLQHEVNFVYACVPLFHLYAFFQLIWQKNCCSWENVSKTPHRLIVPCSPYSNNDVRYGITLLASLNNRTYFKDHQPPGTDGDTVPLSNRAPVNRTPVPVLRLEDAGASSSEAAG